MPLRAEQNRTFGYAAAASVALHALFLSMNLPAMRAAPAAPPPEPPLVARLVEEKPQEKPAEERRPAPKTKPKSSLRAEPKARPKPKPKPKPRPQLRAAAPVPPPPAAPAPAPRPEPEAPAEAPIAPPAPAAPVPAPPAPALASVAPAPVVAPPPDPRAAITGFRQRLVDLAGRYKRYPLVARDNGWTGDVVVRVQVAASGEIASVEVKRSSGYDVLDAQALEMFRKAAPAVAVPADLRGRAFSVEVRAVYNLRDG